VPLPNGPCDGKGPSREGSPPLVTDRLDLNSIDLAGLSREDVLAALTDAAIEAYEDAGPAEFAWDESKHPRGQPANRGQFGPGGGGTPSKAERSTARVERKRAEKAADRQESGAARHLNNLLRERTYDINQAHAHLPEGVPTPALDRAIAALSPSTHGRDLGEKLAAFERVRDEAEREGRLTGALQRLAPRHQESEMLGHLETIRRHAESAAAAVRLEMQAREATRAQNGRRAAVFAAAVEAAEFYSPDQARDWRGRWTAGGGSDGGQSVPTHAERGQLRQASLQAVREYVRAGGQPTQVENEQLAAHLARLTVQQLHQVKAEHGLKASGKDKAALVGKLAERFRAHRQTQEPAGAKALKEAVAGKPGFHNVREVLGGHAVSHGPTGSQVRADHAGTRFDVLTAGSTLHSSHATAAAAVKAAEQSGRFGTGQSTAEQEHAARQEAMRKSQERAAAEKVGGAPKDVPSHVAHAIATVYGPNETHEAYVRARGRERGTYEYQQDHGAKDQADRRRAESLVKQAQEIARKNGWDWEKVKDVARKQLGLNENWRTAESQRFLGLEAEHRSRLEGRATEGRQIAEKAAAENLAKERARQDAERAVREEPERRKAEAIRQEAQRQQDAREQHVKDVVGWLEKHLTPAHREVLASGTKKDRDKLITNIMFAHGTRNEAAVREAVSRVVGAWKPRRGKGSAGFSVPGAMSPEEAEERAALRRVESYADRENARLRAVREGVRA
jgi:hypothetical protein